MTSQYKQKIIDQRIHSGKTFSQVQIFLSIICQKKKKKDKISAIP